MTEGRTGARTGAEVEVDTNFDESSRGCLNTSTPIDGITDAGFLAFRTIRAPCDDDPTELFRLQEVFDATESKREESVETDDAMIDVVGLLECGADGMDSGVDGGLTG